MKKILVYSFITIFSFSFFTGCGVETSDIADTTQPVVTLNGPANVTVTQGLEYIEEGATAVDDADGDLNVTISGVVDTYVAGSYLLTYSATDNVGNIGTATRTVNVEPIGYRAVVGYVRDFNTATPLANISVNSGTETVVTNEQGIYVLPVDTAGDIERLVVNFGGNGYAQTGEIVSIGADDNATAFLSVNVLPIASFGTYDATEGFTVQVDNSPAKVVIEAGSLVDEEGNAAVGDVIAKVTPIDPSLDIEIMPGDLKVSSGESIASFGALTVNFEDMNGNALDLGTGKTATIRIPASTRGEALHTTIPLFYFDENMQGYWFDEGNATLSADKTYYEGEVSHFTTWNADYIYDSISVSGCVQDQEDERVANALIRLEGNDYNGMNSAQTDESGNFTVSAKKDATSLISASKLSSVSNTIILGDDEDTSADMTLTDCLILGTHSLVVRLTWGLVPSDLDTHVIGPNDYHIKWTNKGSLTEEPYANLDVDDVTSYGPEVFTAFSFPEAGTYHYAIYNWSRVPSGITPSPARVELTLDGETTVFTPPPGETDETYWWNVFDIIVDENGGITIEVINTWSTDETAPGPSSSLGRVSKEVIR